MRYSVTHRDAYERDLCVTTYDSFVEVQERYPETNIRIGVWIELGQLVDIYIQPAAPDDVIGQDWKSFGSI